MQTRATKRSKTIISEQQTTTTSTIASAAAHIELLARISSGYINERFK